jgi:hypothetical protein
MLVDRQLPWQWAVRVAGQQAAIAHDMKIDAIRFIGAQQRPGRGRQAEHRLAANQFDLACNRGETCSRKA